MTDDIMTTKSEYKRLLESIQQYYGFDTEGDTVDFILSHEDDFSREFIRYLEAI